MKPGISSRLTGVKYRLAGFSLRAAKQELQKAEQSLRRTYDAVKSIELSHKKLLHSVYLGERLHSRYYVKGKQMESLREEVGLKEKDLQKKAHLEERWRVFHDETRGREVAIREAMQAEDLMESHTIRAATGADNLFRPTQSFIPSDIGATSMQSNKEECRGAEGAQEEGKLPVITELVEGRVIARLQREGDSLQIILITHSLKDQQLLSHFRKKYQRIVEKHGNGNASIRVERRKK